MSGFVIFPDDDSLFDERDFLDFVSKLDGASIVSYRGRLEEVVSFRFEYGGEEVDVELGDDLGAVVIDSDNDAALEFAIRLQKSTGSPLRIVDEMYSFDRLLVRYLNTDDLKRDFNASSEELSG